MLLSISIKLIMSCRTLLFYARWCGSRSSFGGNSLVNPHEQTRFGGVYYMYKCCICYFNNITHTCTVHQMLVNIGSLPNTPLITRMACHHHLTSPLCSMGWPTCMAVTVAFHLCQSWAALLASQKLMLMSITVGLSGCFCHVSVHVRCGFQSIMRRVMFLSSHHSVHVYSSTQSTSSVFS